MRWCHKTVKFLACLASVRERDFLNYKKFVRISTVALLVATPVPVMAFWVQLFTYVPPLVGLVYYVGGEIVGEIIYTESCYVEETTLWHYGY